MIFIDWIYHKINKHRRNQQKKRKREEKKKDGNKDDDDLNEINKIIAIVEFKNL